MESAFYKENLPNIGPDDISEVVRTSHKNGKSSITVNSVTAAKQFEFKDVGFDYLN
jgi:hypothetical protein